MRNKAQAQDMMLTPAWNGESQLPNARAAVPENEDGPGIVRISELELINDILENFSSLDGIQQLFADFSGLGAPADFTPNGVEFYFDDDFELGGLDRVRTSGIAEISIIGTPFDDLVRVRENVVFFDGIGGFDIVTINLEDLTSDIVIDFLTGGDQLSTAGYMVRNVEGVEDIRTGSGNDSFLIGSTVLNDAYVNVIEGDLGFDTITFDFTDFVYSPDQDETVGIQTAAVGPFWFELGDDEAYALRLTGFEEVSVIGTRYDDNIEFFPVWKSYDGGEGNDRVSLFFQNVTDAVIFDTSNPDQHLSFGDKSITNIEIFDEIRTGSGDDLFRLNGDFLEAANVSLFDGSGGFDRVEADFSDFAPASPADTAGIAFDGEYIDGISTGGRARLVSVESISILGSTLDDFARITNFGALIEFDGGAGSDTVEVIINSDDAVLIDLTVAENQLTFGDFRLSNAELVSNIRLDDGDDVIRLSSDNLIGDGTASGGSEVFAFGGNDTLILQLAASHPSDADNTSGAFFNGQALFYGNSQVGFFNSFEFLEITGSDANDIIFGDDGIDVLNGGNGADILRGGRGNDTIDGGANVDIAQFDRNSGQYTITQIAVGVFEISGFDGTDIVRNVEFAQFDDVIIRLLPGEGVAVDFDTADPSIYQSAMDAIRDFDGNVLGGDGSWLRIGEVDVNGDGDIDQILVNDAIGRFATVGTAPDGLVYFDDHGWAGETRVAGIYIDPLVEAGIVEAGSEFDSQVRFQNDLFIENINRVLGADDYDGDGFQEVYFALTDGTAYLRALMHADGNIFYANYQTEEQVREYLTANGYDESTFGDWFGNGAQGQRAQDGNSAEVIGTAPWSQRALAGEDGYATSAPQTFAMLDDNTLEKHLEFVG